MKSIALTVVRIILTSSIVAMMGDKKSGTFTPEDWTDANAKDFSMYAKSNTLAERTAWGIVKHRTDQNKFELVVLNPGGVFGPTLEKNIEGQLLTVLAQMLSGSNLLLNMRPSQWLIYLMLRKYV